MIVIEELERARARGAKIYAELLGYGVSSDATHVSDPDPTGQSPARALAMAFADAGITPDEVGYINAHGTSTPVGDIAETRVIKIALGEEKAHRTPVSSTKGATGHCLGAAGAVEATFTILALQRGILPPTINQETPTPSAISTTSRTSRAKSRSRSACRTRSASAATTRASCSAVGTRTGPDSSRAMTAYGVFAPFYDEVMGDRGREAAYVRNLIERHQPSASDGARARLRHRGDPRAARSALRGHRARLSQPMLDIAGRRSRRRGSSATT